MLILQRKPGESLFIGEDVEVTVVAIDAGRVRLAINAPRSLSILRSELRGAATSNREAAQEEAAPIELLDFLGGLVPRENVGTEHGEEKSTEKN